MNKLLLILIITMPCKILAQQKIIFYNQKNHKKIIAEYGSNLSVYYNGYLGQKEFYKNTITNVTDSSVFLGIMNSDIGIFKNILPSGKEIMINDITVFRKISNGRNLSKSLFSIAVIFGSFYLLNQQINKNNNSVLENFAITLGIGITSKAIVNIIFNEKPKHKINDGWVVLTEK